MFIIMLIKLQVFEKLENGSDTRVQTLLTERHR